MTRVLVLRPEPGASATAKRVRERGLDPVTVPLFKVEPLAWDPPEASRFDGILLTSGNAVRHAGEGLRQLRGLPAYAVGATTADAAREAGFDIASTGDAGVDRLLGSIEPDIRLLHLCGEDRRAPADTRQEIESIAVYRSSPNEDPDLSGAKHAVVLIHSPRAGQRLAELVQPADKPAIRIVAISTEAAQAAGTGWAAVEAAGAPNDEALLALTERLCNNMPAK
jgi:uroporphyrinogen-III synthase